ncbi:hypothetical protein FEM08_21340 [Flavobacterium gilvum]|nr:hypothetical protein FEM08_21340 [Flavobacterium gilvum]
MFLDKLTYWSFTHFLFLFFFCLNFKEVIRDLVIQIKEIYKYQFSESQILMIIYYNQKKYHLL